MAHHFEQTITVSLQHLDNLNHVNNVVYVQLMQDLAIEHWNHVAPASLNELIIWVVKRHEIDYHAQAMLGDILLLKTYTGQATAVTWDRHFEFIRQSDQKKIITAKSCWVLLDKLSGRPRRIDDTIRSVFD
jgi:acyl-CoA thioester hydrolase